MKVKFIEKPLGRDFKVGDVVEFNGPIPEGYARKYIARGWAEEYSEPVAQVEVARPTQSASSRRASSQGQTSQASFAETSNKKSDE